MPLLRVYVSEQAHSSIEKAVITLGLGQRGLRKIPTDDEFRMDVQALAEAIEEDKRNGYLPFCIVATVGTTSTSSIDPVHEIIPIGEEHAMWLHVDAAYAGSAAVVPELRHILDGCERADSLVVNPHKWLFTPFDLSVLYCRHMDLLRRAFSLVPEYLRTPEQEKVRSGSDYGIQLGRRFRALKLWMIIRYFGHEGLAARIREHCRLAQLFASWVDESPDWEVAGAGAAGAWFVSARVRQLTVRLTACGKSPGCAERSDHAWRECDRQSVAFAHETERQADAAALDRKYSHD